jgi:hypothetical protein
MPTAVEISVRFIALGIIISPSYRLNAVLDLGDYGNKPCPMSGTRDLFGKEEG